MTIAQTSLKDGQTSLLHGQSSLRHGQTSLSSLAALPWWRRAEHKLDGVVPGFVLDVLKGRYALNNRRAVLSDLISVANNSAVRTYRDAQGKFRLAAPNTPRIDYSNGVPELLLTGAYTNKCTENNVDPASGAAWSLSGAAGATMTVVTDVSEIAAAGLDALVPNGKVFKFDNSGGGSNAFALATGAAGNTNTHVASAYVRIASGSTGRVEISGGSGSTAFSNTAYQRVDCVAVPNSSVRTFALTAAAGTIVYCILMNLVEAAAPMPIVPNTTGAALSVSADLCPLAASAATVLQGVGGAMAWRGALGSILPSQSLIGMADAAVVNRYGWLRSGAGTPTDVGYDAVASGVFTIGTYTAGENVGIAAGFGASGRNGAKNGGAVGSGSGPIDRPRNNLFIGSASGLASGQIIRIRQFVGWSLPDRPSASGIQSQARLAA